MRLAYINSESDPKNLEAIFFAEAVAKKTNGKVKVEVYPGAVLGGWRELIEGLNLGTDEIVIEGFGTLSAYTNLANLDAVPFLFIVLYSSFSNLKKKPYWGTTFEAGDIV